VSVISLEEVLEGCGQMKFDNWKFMVSNMTHKL